MINTYPLMEKAVKGFNEKRQTSEDFHRILDDEDIYLDFWKLAEGVNGFYGVNRLHKKPRRYIVIDERLHQNDSWLLTGFHELVHHFLHVPQTSFEVYYSKCNVARREEREADRYALLMLIPLPLLKEMMQPGCDLIYQFSAENLSDRLKINEQYGI
ncbi:MAG: ImmA/IrrE family metallo-endopeptidase [Pyrinomonadaceae bacterium]